MRAWECQPAEIWLLREGVEYDYR